MKNTAENNLTYHLLIAGAIVVAFYLLSRPARRLLQWIGSKIISRTDTVLDDRILKVFLVHVRPLMIVGFVILVDRPFRVGDRIELPSGQIGDVQEIGLRSTKLLNFDSNLLIIPNAELVRNRIINYAYPFNKMRVQLKVLVARGAEIARVRAILIDLASRHPSIVKDPAPEVYFTAINDSSLELSLEARCEDYTRRYAAETSLREQMYDAFRRESIEIPLPQRVVQMKANT